SSAIEPVFQPAKSAGLPPSKSPAPLSSLSPAAADYKRRIEQIAAEKHLRLSIKGSGSTLTLSGKLRPPEHSELLKFLRSAPSGAQVVDDIQYDDSAAPPSAVNAATRPDPTPSTVAAIRITTNVPGATASLGSGSSPARQCETPCSFS